MQKKLIFDKTGDDRQEAIQILNGHPTSLLKLVDVKYSWALVLYKKMLENFWIPEKVNLNQDITDFTNLPDNQKRAFKGSLSFLVFLDSIQTTNLPRLSDYITASEVNLALTTQSFQEAIHSQSYGYLIETIIPKEEVAEVYDFWRTDDVLLSRITYIASKYQAFSDDQTTENFIQAILSNYILESIYFYVGFNFFYWLAYTHRMQATSQIFAYINR
jgi:ribonucleoside-diphosphate reductase beta chain